MTKGFDKRLRYSYIYCLKERDICLLSETSLSTQTVFATFDLWPLVLISRSHLAIAFSIVFTYILLSGRRKGKDFQHFHHLPWFVFCLPVSFVFIFVWHITISRHWTHQPAGEQLHSCAHQQLGFCLHISTHGCHCPLSPGDLLWPSPAVSNNSWTSKLTEFYKKL